ncbi:FT-interacting protein 7 [Camellia lanceoleosa]|uniref:FT-interacting protein 7 n=1 Tax=Camellia lanceoleosa TaxID=1840588 RepID=A0ACC0FGV0_9ERIC|nr:FT-interacting protein 7 [Camellia lanceoleosa]
MQSSVLEVVVMDKDLVKDDFAGIVRFDLNEVPTRVPPDSPLAPEWYRLEDKKGEKKKGELMLAVWIGTQADEAFLDAWHSDFRLADFIWLHTNPVQSLPCLEVMYNVQKPSSDNVEPSKKDKDKKFSTRLQLRIYPDGGYHMLDESTQYSSDLRPTARQLWKKSIGILELGILNADALHPMKTRDGRGTSDTYCVAKPLELRFREKYPPHMNTRISVRRHALDELDEEFDTFPTSKSAELVRYRYDRLRSVVGKIQTVVGDVASQGEQVQALLSWCDPRATTIFVIFCLFAAVVLYSTPLKALAGIAGFYVMRHPRFRHKLPSAPLNFFRRLPARTDSLL